MGRSATSEHGVRGFDSQYGQSSYEYEKSKRLEGSSSQHCPWRGDGPRDHYSVTMSPRFDDLENAGILLLTIVMWAKISRDDIGQV